MYGRMVLLSKSAITIKMSELEKKGYVVRVSDSEIASFTEILNFLSEKRITEFDKK